MKTLEYTRNGLAIIAASMATYIAYDYFRSVSLEPYRIHAHNFETLADGNLLLTGDFTKNSRGELGECDLETFRVYGVSDGILVPLQVSDVQGWENDTSREAGEHDLAVLIDMSDGPYESVEARTRHLCLFESEEGQLYERLVSRVFARHVVITER